MHTYLRYVTLRYDTLRYVMLHYITYIHNTHIYIYSGRIMEVIRWKNEGMYKFFFGFGTFWNTIPWILETHMKEKHAVQ